MRPRPATLLLALALSMPALPLAAAPVSASKATDLRGAIDDLTLAAANHGYQLVKVQPIDNALVKRGYANPHLRLAFIGKAELVEEAMARDPALLSLLPLRLTLLENAGRVRVESDDLAAWDAQLPGSRDVLARWERDLARILDDYVGE